MEETTSSLHSDYYKQQLEGVMDKIARCRHNIREMCLNEEFKTNKAGDFLYECDALRDNLLNDHGIIIEDREEGSLVRFLDSESFSLMKLQIKDEEDKRLEMIRMQDAKRQSKAAKAAIVPSQMFVGQTDLYSQFDSNGVPTHDAKGEELSKNARKRLLKEYEAQVKLHEQHLRE